MRGNHAEIALANDYRLYAIVTMCGTDAFVAIVYRPTSNTYVVAWNYDVCDGTWQQGYYFNDYESALRKFREYVR